MNRYLLVFLLIIGSPTLSSCGDEGITLPSGFNTGRYQQIEIAPQQTIAAPKDTVHALNGMHGAPSPIISGDPDLRTKYWGRLAGSNEADGAHVRMVRIGTDTLCDISLESVFPDATAPPDAIASYNFTELDKRMYAILGGINSSGQQIKGLNTAKVLWQVGLDIARPGDCKATPEGWQLGSPFSDATLALWPQVAINTLRHLRADTGWAEAQNLNVSYVEFLDDPWSRLSYPANTLEPAWDRLREAYKTFANDVKKYWPDGDTPQVHVGGISFTFNNATQLNYATEADKHPLLSFIDYCKANSAPLDFVSFKKISIAQ